jgi:hypothetical protein
VGVEGGGRRVGQAGVGHETYGRYYHQTGNTKGGSITVPLTSCLTGSESAVWQLTIFVFICKTDQSKPVKQEVNSTVMLPHLVYPAVTFDCNQGILTEGEGSVQFTS